MPRKSSKYFVSKCRNAFSIEVIQIKQIYFYQKLNLNKSFKIQNNRRGSCWETLAFSSIPYSLFIARKHASVGLIYAVIFFYSNLKKHYEFVNISKLNSGFQIFLKGVREILIFTHFILTYLSLIYISRYQKHIC